MVGEVGLAALAESSPRHESDLLVPKTANSTVFPELYREGFTNLSWFPKARWPSVFVLAAGVAFMTQPPWERLAEGKESREFDGRTYLLEHGLTADFALIKGVQSR